MGFKGWQGWDLGIRLAQQAPPGWAAAAHHFLGGFGLGMKQGFPEFLLNFCWVSKCFWVDGLLKEEGRYMELLQTRDVSCLKVLLR